MAPISIEFHPLAIREARAARRWYARRSMRVGFRFMIELDRVIDQIATGPASFPSYLHGTRVLRLRRFPYLVVYLDDPTAVRVIAIAHGHRRPGYWRRRTR